MKFLVVLAVLVAVCSARRSEEEIARSFATFVKTYHKAYSPDEFNTRMQNFANSLKKIDQLNAGNDGAKYGITQFSDMSQEEFRRYPCGVDRLSELNGRRPDFQPNMAGPLAAPESAIPTAWDWTEHGAVTPIKNQAQCGSCWAFSTIGNIEGVTFLKTKTLVGLSEQQEVSCSKTSYGCEGGWPFWAMSDMLAAPYNGQIDTEAGYPYTSGEGDNGVCSFSTSDVGTTITSYKSYCTEETDPCTEQQMMQLLVQKGPLSACLDAGPMQYYQGGIQNPSDCDPAAIDHCITIVGYGHTNGTDFWKIKNSWGTTWGEEGYYFLQRGSGLCGINKVITIASE